MGSLAKWPLPIDSLYFVGDELLRVQLEKRKHDFSWPVAAKLPTTTALSLPKTLVREIAAYRR